MALSLAQNTYALRPSLGASFLAAGGVEPYAYSVEPGGAGGSINITTGAYTAPATASYDPLRFFDTIRVDDYDGAYVTARILVGGPLQIVMDILQREMALADGRVYLYNQKIMQPTDSGLYIAMRVESSDCFGQSRRAVENGLGLDSHGAVSMIDRISFDLISRSTESLLRRAEFLRVWNGNYAKGQQNLNSLLIGRDPERAMMMIPDVDGAAIPYRFRVSYYLQYAERAVGPVAYYDTIDPPEIYTNP